MRPDEYRKLYGNFTALLYGPGGGGKTVLAAAVSKFGPTRILDLQKGAISAITGGSRFIDEQNLDIVPIRNMNEFNDAVAQIEQDRERLRFVAIDTISELDDMIESEYMENSPNQMEYKDYREKLWRMMRITRFFRDSGLNIIMTANDEVDKKERIIPLLDGKLRALLPNQIDIVCYVGIKDTPMGVSPTPTGGPMPSMLTRQVITQSAHVSVRDRFNRLAPAENITDNPALFWAKVLGVPVPPPKSGAPQARPTADPIAGTGTPRR